MHTSNSTVNRKKEQFPDNVLIYYRYFCWFKFLAIIIVNTFVFVVIISKRKLRSQRNNKLFMALLFSHFSNGVWNIIEAVLVNITKQGGIHTFAATGTIRYWFSSLFLLVWAAVFVNMILVVFDRFLAIRYPYLYQRLKARTFLLSALCACVVAIALTIFTTNYFGEIPVVVFVCVLSIVFPGILMYAHASIYYQTRSQFKKMIKLTVTKDADDKKKEKRRLLKRQIRSLRICMLLMASFLITWIPSATLFILQFKGAIGESILMFGYVIICLNSIADPSIYAWYNHDVKTTLKRIVSKQETSAQ
ncbi:uncharacterized protein LOC130622918 [Hydractinia symbiolongicarpus]|uniref:uncharacterized protein LOC130622918 n=1 Tax=Hydractinia symbiolongicarpus TaxID=13093 RepID=UPI00254ABE84|nr:uncharacterized protein LOC130622918 [Hydractinia symbiolongicarpus]